MFIIMGFFEFFWKNKEVESRTIKKVSLVELSYEIENLFNGLRDKTKIIKEDINKNLVLTINNLKVQIKVLKSINLEQRREDERIKRIVSENLESYINHLENLINEFEKTKNLEVKDSISKIQFILEDFYKKSFKSYEKATILIGKEIGHVKEIIKNFNKEFIKIVQENDSVFIKINSINEFGELDNKIKNLKEIKEEINRNINNLQELRGKFERKKYLIEEDYHKFKKSKELKELLIQEQKFNEELIYFNNEILKIKEKINIKFLLKYYHNDNKYSELLKNYRENFIEVLESDENLEIAELVEKALGMNIKEGLFDLKERNRRIKTRDNSPFKTKLKIIEDKIKNIDLEISDLKEKEDEETKKIQRFDRRSASLADEKINKAKSILENIEIINSNEKI